MLQSSSIDVEFYNVYSDRLQIHITNCTYAELSRAALKKLEFEGAEPSRIRRRRRF